MTGPRRVDSGELGADRPDELDDALTTAVWLEAAMPDAPVRPTVDFADRVMAAIEREPTPARAGFLSPVRRQGFVAGFLGSLRQAWASAFTGGRPALVRASALAYVLAVVIGGTALAGAATISVGSALGIIGPSATQSQAPATPAPFDLNRPSGLEPPESDSPEASEEPGDSGSPEASDDHGGGGPDASDDHGGGSPEASDDHGGDGSGSDDQESPTPKPSRTPHPSETPEPSETSSSGGDG